MTTSESPSRTFDYGSDRRAYDFPEGFVWGASTSAFQIEGGQDEDGRVPCIWDTFCAEPGRIEDGSNGVVACDHRRRYVEDVELMADLGLQAYRFSIAWPRVIADLDGTVNAAGLDFYDRLVDELLARDIEPMPTLYHWDLPQFLGDRGGWLERDTAHRFAAYTGVVLERLGDRVGTWTTLNEPFVSANHGYVTGEHAPGHTSIAEGFAASHHLLLAHGLAGQQIRELAPDARLAIVLNFTPVYPATDEPADIDAATIEDQLANYWYADPIGGRGYPVEAAEAHGWDHAEVHADDLDLIAQPIDLLGVNLYTRDVVGASPQPARDVPRNTMGWEIYPPAMGRALRWLDERYEFPALMITENGCPMPDDVHDDLGVVDDDRISYLSQHLAEVHDAIADGVNVEGYLVWSLFDNFEWAWGYGPTFGIVEVDFETQVRTPKKSARWYRDAVAANGFSMGDEQR